mmetsp:Transcript_35270/g.75139  ORF Transcript_35270/g.75139 Transcript_35270/m.75139 type:complete len:100 (-) Transcript_35270:428-727(-)
MSRGHVAHGAKNINNKDCPNFPHSRISWRSSCIYCEAWDRDVNLTRPGGKLVDQEARFKTSRETGIWHRSDFQQSMVLNPMLRIRKRGHELQRDVVNVG